MRIYKAFLINDLVMLKRNWFYLPLFFVFPIAFIISVYTSSKYSPEMAGLMAFAGMILGMMFFSGTFTANTTSFEKINNISFVLFSKNINKLHYLLAKLTTPLVLACINIVIPAIIYYTMNLFTTTISLAYTIVFTLFFPIIFNLASVLFSQLLNRGGDIILVTLASVVLILIGVLFIGQPLVYPVFFSLIILCVFTVALFIGVYILLCKKEAKINFNIK